MSEVGCDTAGEITLPIGATAEPDTCGSCKFFRRKDDGCTPGSVWGKCGFVMPPIIATSWDIRGLDPKQKDREYTGNEDTIKDTARCDLYRHSGKVYIVQRRIPMARE